MSRFTNSEKSLLRIEQNETVRPAGLVFLWRPCGKVPLSADWLEFVLAGRRLVVVVHFFYGARLPGEQLLTIGRQHGQQSLSLLLLVCLLVAVVVADLVEEAAAVGVGPTVQVDHRALGQQGGVAQLLLEHRLRQPGTLEGGLLVQLLTLESLGTAGLQVVPFQGHSGHGGAIG